jgi:hypothetical protein
LVKEREREGRWKEREGREKGKREREGERGGGRKRERHSDVSQMVLCFSPHLGLSMGKT